jgi:hypothetical protein
MSFVKDPNFQQPNMQKTNSVNLGQPMSGLVIPVGRRNPQTLSGGSSLPSGSK